MGESRYLRACLAGALLLAVACSGGNGETSGDGSAAAAAVETFYDHLNAGRFDDAKALYTEEARGQIFPDESADEGFAAWAEIETQAWSLSAVEVLSETEADGGVTVEYQLSFSDGGSVQRQVTVTEEAGGWKLGFIG